MLKEFIKDNILIFDGAMGTAIQSVDIDNKIWGDKNGCNEYLNLVAPEIIEKIHKDYFIAGANVAVTNTFGAISSVLAEYGLQDKVVEINKKAVEIAKRASNGIDNAFISLSVGPGTKLATLGHTTYNDLYSQYYEQVECVINDIDMVNIETCQDLLQIKAALNASVDVAKKANKELPIIVSVTIEENGSLLTGSDISAVATLFRHAPIIALGFNCAFGPDFMEQPISKLAEIWNGNIYLSANAGMPETVDGKTFYPMDAQDFAKIVGNIVDKYSVSFIGGCCGTNVTHIEALKSLNLTKKANNNNYIYNGEASSMYTSTPLIQEPAPALIGERANATGSKAFREVLLAHDLDKVVAICKAQEDEGAHFIDLSTAYAGRNELDDYIEIVPLLNTALRAPIVIDSTDVNSIKASLERYAGKPIINSINFEDGGDKLHKILNDVKSHPACVVALTIDEKGMAQTADSKYEIAKRIYDVWVNDYKFAPEDLIFDTLTFSIGSGDETLKNAAIETIDAIKLIKENLKGAKTVLGVSNISFGLSAKSRPVLNSVFLAEAVKAGLDTAIVHASKLTSVSSLDSKDIDACMNLIYNKDNALSEFIEHFENFEGSSNAQVDVSNLTPNEALYQKIVKGDKSELNELINEVVKTIKPDDVINDILFPAMQHVGDLFGEGKMLLPFVLQSAEAMKAAVSIIEPMLQKKGGSSNGKIVLATVAGDVHDIGKNLVDIMMSNNGYAVHNLGIKVPVEDMIAKAKEVNADAIGMSGLLVKSTLIMKDNIEKIAKELPNIKIMLGGAALTSKFVEESCVPIMPDKVYHCRDAFDNIKVMSGSKQASKVREVKKMAEIDIVFSEDSNPIERENNIPVKPFDGIRKISNININDIFKYLDKKSLFNNAWGYKPKDDKRDEYDMMIKKVVEPELKALRESITNENVVDAKVIYGYFNVRRKRNSLEVFSDNSEYTKCVFNFPKRKAPPHNTIADYFIGDEDSFDVLPIQIVTLGDKCASYCKSLFDAGNFKDYYMTHGLLTELTEALAEYMHAKIRRELNIDTNRGRRYSFGYPLAPDIEYNDVIAKLLSADNIGVSISEVYEMIPEYTTSAIIVHHNKASY